MYGIYEYMEKLKKSFYLRAYVLLPALTAQFQASSMHIGILLQKRTHIRPEIRRCNLPNSVKWKYM
jgi:hypothetical protein